MTPYSAQAWAYGGIPRLAGCLTRGLAERGHQVTVCTTDACNESARLPTPDGNPRGREPWSFRTAECAGGSAGPVGPVGVDVRVFPNVSNRLAYRLQLFLPIGFSAYLKRHAGAFDVAHLHACRNAPGVMAAHRLGRAGVPYVLAPNGTAPRIERRRLAKWVFDQAFGRRVVDGAARVLAVSQAERLQLRELGVPEPAIRVIPNPVDLEEFKAPATPGRFRQRHGLPPGPVMMFLGKLTPRKRLDVVVRAFARLRRPDVRLVIAGNDMGAGAETRALVRALGVDGRTIFTGLLEGQERIDALSDADVLVYPSQHEIFGLVPLEAILSGTPVIVADDSGCGEIVRAIGGGLVVPLGDADEVARAVERVLDEPSMWLAATTEAATRIKAAFGVDVVCSQLERLYEEMIRSAPCKA